MMKINKYKLKIINIFILCFIIGLVISILFYNHFSKKELIILINNVKEKNIFSKVNNNIIDHLKILSVILVLSFIYIGIPLFIGYIISIFFKISFKLIIITKIYKLKGLIYGLLYILITEGFFIFIMYYFFKKILKLVKYIYSIKNKKDLINYNELYSILIKTIVLIIIIFISDIIIGIYGNHFLNLINFICKV